MNIRSRFLIILSVIAVSMVLIWPNIGVSTVQVRMLPGLSEEETSGAVAAVDAFLKQSYTGKYRWTIVPAGKDNPEAYVQVEGRFIQTAFLNELARIPNVDPDRVSLVPMWAEANLFAKRFKLGLDLQGGMNLVLAGDFDRMAETLRARYTPEYIASLEAEAAAEKDPAKKTDIENRVKSIKDSLNFTEERKRNDIAGALEIIRARIDKTGVSEPLIRMQGTDRIEISLPGVASPERAKAQISSVAKVEYRLAEPAGAGRNLGAFGIKANELFAEFAEAKGERARELALRNIEKKIALPANYELFPYYSNQKDEKGATSLRPAYLMALEKEIALSGDAMSRNVYEYYDPENLQNTVQFELTSEGRERFGRITTENKGRQLAILIDGKIRSAPFINEPILGGQASISGSFTPDEAKSLALIIREGALPVPMKIVEERSVGPSLGKESIEAGLVGVTIGLILVAAFMMLYYEAAGIVSVIALILNLLFMAAIMTLMDFTITLPGFAGIVLTLGMAVDANVIIFERIREEISKGRSFKTAVTQGFERATWTILDSNLTTLIVAIVLASKLGVGPIKGFGVTLFIGIITSLFTALYVTKTFFYALAFGVNFDYLPMGRGRFNKPWRELRSGKEAKV